MMMDFPSLSIIVLCLIILLVFLKTKRYDSLQGAAIAAITIAALVLKLAFGKPSPYFFNPGKFLISGILVMAFTMLCTLFLLHFRKNKIKIRYVLTLFVLYILFGFLQQLLFQFIFLETIYILTANLWLSIIVGALFYLLFHLYGEFDTKFKLMLFIFGICWGYFYLIYQNIFWLAISHAILGTLYYGFVVDKKAIRKKLGKRWISLLPES
jgi:hypothetical protein